MQDTRIEKQIEDRIAWLEKEPTETIYKIVLNITVSAFSQEEAKNKALAIVHSDSNIKELMQIKGEK